MLSGLRVGLASARGCVVGVVVGSVVCAAPAWAASSHTAYVTNRISDSVTPIDTATNTAGTAIAVGSNPAAVAITPDGKTAYVANDSSGSVTPIDTATNTAGTAIAVGSGPSAVAITPDGQTAYVANEVSGSVTPIDTATNTAGMAIAVGSQPGAVAITPDGKTAYVANAASGSVTPIDTATNTAGTAIAVGRAPFAVAITPDGQTVYVTSFGLNSVTPIDTATNTAGAAIAVGSNPFGVAITPDGKTAYVANFNSGSVTPIDTATNTAGAAIAVGSGPLAVAITPDGKTAYVITQSSNSVTPIDTATNTAGTPITVGDAPDGVAVTPDQAPAAAFSATVAPAGQASSFDASASSDPDGTVASYHWDFGDGTSQTTVSPTVTRTYATSNTYTVTLTVTDDAGCSTALVFTGQTASCNAAPKAQTTRQLTIAPPPPPPLPQISSPANGARYMLRQVVPASYACQDSAGGPGIASCIGPVPSGQAIDTTTLGRHTFTVTATSKDAQTATSIVTYTVQAPNNHFTVSRIKTHRNGSVTFNVKIPGPGTIDVLETAWKNNLATAAVLLQPAARRFVIARHHKTAPDATTLKLRVTPNKTGKRLVRHHTYRVTLRLWVSYTPTGGRFRKQGFYGLHLPR
jgi:YVTN family beta-propeller protein